MEFSCWLEDQRRKILRQASTMYDRFKFLNIYLNFYFGHLVIWLNLNVSNFEILKNDKFEPKFDTQNDFNIKSDEYVKVMNTKVVQLIKIYHFYFGHLIIWLNLNLSNFEIWKKTSWNHNLDPQIISTEKVMNTKVE